MTTTSARPKPVRPESGLPLATAPSALGFTIDEAANALRTLPFGGVDESTRALRLPPAIQATVAPVIASIRWGAVMFGMVFAAVQASDGDFSVVTALAVILFLTTWRTLRPIRLASDRTIDRVLSISDTVVVGAAVGWSGSFSSPFVFCALAAAAVGAFGWGLVFGLVLVLVGVVAMAGGAYVGDASFEILANQPVALLASFALPVAIIAFARARLVESEQRRATLAGRIDMLAETNDLLHILNQVARTLPTSLDLTEAMNNARDQIRRAFDAKVIALVINDEGNDAWVPQITDGCSLRPSAGIADLPTRLAEALDSATPLLVNDLDRSGGGVGTDSRSGMYTAVRARGRNVGVLAIEHGTANQYRDRDVRILDGLSEVLALTVDNARSFRRLRTLGAEEERSRIARDLHDRLGQWLSYISFELERIIETEESPPKELDHLYGDVQTAIEELRETLRQLRSSVTEENPLAVVGAELVERFNRRGGAIATFTVVDAEATLPVRIENELLRVMQEALSNIDKHAEAETVEIVWDVLDGNGTLTVKDNGKGFDPDHGIRDSAYGLVGMRERADGVGARLQITSEQGVGTTITVRAGLSLEEAQR